MSLLAEQPTMVSPVALPPGPSMRQLPLDFEPMAPAGLTQFVPEGNEELLAWLSAWPDSAQPGTPTYLWGAHGSGKTHLLRGLASQAQGLAGMCCGWAGRVFNRGMRARTTPARWC